MSDSIPEKKIVLFVGEGDFSFAASYLKKYKTTSEHVFASCLSSNPLNSEQEVNIKFIQEKGATLLLDVDATNIENHPVLKQHSFSKIYFNFPHVPRKMNLRDNRKLVQLFLNSAKKVLKENGKIFVALCKGQGGTAAEVVKRDWCNTWKIVDLAANAGLKLCDIYPFLAEEFSGYSCTGYRGLFKAFVLEGALTHVFSHGEIASHNFKLTEENSIEIFERDIKDLYNLICKKEYYPCAKLVPSLYKETAFPISHNIFVQDLLICRNHLYDSENLEKLSSTENLVYCTACLNDILSIYFKQKISEATTAVICSVTCFSDFNLSNLPFSHLSLIIDYRETFSDVYVSTISKVLKDPYFDCDKSFLTWLDIGMSLKDTTVVESQKDIGLKVRDVKVVSYVYAICSVIQSNANFFYKLIDVEVKEEKVKSNNSSTAFFEIANILRFSHENKDFSGLLLNLSAISLIKYHIFDKRVLLSNEGYFVSKKCHDTSMQIFRSPSLFPPSYIHDMSFWINEGFQERYFFIVIKNNVGCLIKEVFLIDSYYNDSINRYSRCYRFIYKSCDKIISQKFIANIHSNLRKILEKNCPINLR